MNPESTADDVAMKLKVMEAMYEVIDPELGINVVDLGLVYGVHVVDGSVAIEMTMTTPACPLGEHIQLDAQTRLGAIPGVKEVSVQLVWDPPWGPERMSDEAKEMLGRPL